MPPALPLVFLGLGSNVDDRLTHLNNAVSALKQAPGVALVASSSVYSSAALLPQGAPKDWDADYLNAVISIRTTLSPQELLASLKDIEHALGRRHRGVWGPREIDIDIVLYGNEGIDSPALSIPHAQMLCRDFVIIPLSEIAGDSPLPGMAPQITIQEYAKKLFAENALEKCFPPLFLSL